MRTIKFRGKRFDPVDGAVMDWIYGTPCFSEDGSKAAMFYIVNGCETMTLIDPATIGQYTGLLDSEGKEIYEGDVVDFISGVICDVGLVKYHITGFLIEYHRNSTHHHTYISKCKVIGNIHDNPELMEDGQ